MQRLKAGERALMYHYGTSSFYDVIVADKQEAVLPPAQKKVYRGLVGEIRYILDRAGVKYGRIYSDTCENYRRIKIVMPPWSVGEAHVALFASRATLGERVYADPHEWVGGREQCLQHAIVVKVMK